MVVGLTCPVPASSTLYFDGEICLFIVQISKDGLLSALEAFFAVEDFEE